MIITTNTVKAEAPDVHQQLALSQRRVHVGLPLFVAHFGHSLSTQSHNLIARLQVAQLSRAAWGTEPVTHAGVYDFSHNSESL